MLRHRRRCSVTVQAARCPHKRAISTAEVVHLLDAAPGDCQRLPTCEDSAGRKDVSVDPGLIERPLRGTRSKPWLRVLARRPGRRAPKSTPGAFTYEWKTDRGPRYPS